MSLPGLPPRINQLLAGEQPTTTEPLRGVPYDIDGCYCGTDADLDRLRELLQQGWSQYDASFFIWGPGPFGKYADHLADMTAAWNLANQLLEEYLA